ncbi:hypothetical protein SCB71_21350 (plasmid) [Herbiconiux sp. KACC 21604]|uniref:hypothetical protein n=1 Tax=unclassified Herbiconiux TaxID=2618217 RepID=UPI0014926341|nr:MULTISPECIES: hypothetical protein [unclassified Herbiconiux]QJU56291.1 hypothetical protein HL652_21150 [Herbiconiux sp. SALV-R1]WPO88796.1 hypothetical protein SCB71_21350 [Herbiconiux sp. KACC 21604]
MARTEARPPRRIWPWFLAGAAVIAAAVIVLVVTLRPVPTDVPVDAAPPPTPTPTSTLVTDAEPTGCLGGPGRDADMLLAAQAAAPHTTNGAVEVAAAMVRWTFRYPGPDSAEANQVGDAIVASTASPEFADLASAAAANPNPSRGVVPDGTEFYLSTVPGVWHVESAEANRAEISIGSAYVIDGALSPQLRSVSTFELVWQGGMWKLEGGSFSRSTQDLYAIGTTFTGGC